MEQVGFGSVLQHSWGKVNSNTSSVNAMDIALGGVCHCHVTHRALTCGRVLQALNPCIWQQRDTGLQVAGVSLRS